MIIILIIIIGIVTKIHTEDKNRLISEESESK